MSTTNSGRPVTTGGTAGDPHPDDPVGDWISNRTLPGEREAQQRAALDDDERWAYTFACEAEALAAYDDPPEPELEPEPEPREASDAPAPADPPVQENTRAARLRAFTYRRSQLDHIPPPTYLIDGILNDNVLGVLAGKFGTYKSFVSVAWACSIATGVPWLGCEIPAPGPVVYIAAEGASGLRARIEAWEAAHLDEGERVADERLVVVGGSLNLSLGGDVDAIIGLCAEVNPKLVIWDTLHRCAPGVEENSSTEMGVVRHHLDQIREASKAAQLVNHHTGHAGVRARGTSSLEDDFDNSWVIRLGGDNEDRSAKTPRTMEHRKIKDGVLSSEIPIELVTLGPSAYVQRAAKDDDAKSSWVAATYLADLADEVGVPKGAGRRSLKDAVMAKHPDQKHAESVWSEAARIRKDRLS